MVRRCPRSSTPTEASSPTPRSRSIASPERRSVYASQRRRRTRRGGALIEACVALVILASAGSGLVALLGQTAHSIRTTFETERETRRAADELARLVLADRTTLLTRLGRTTARGWTIDMAA